MSQQESSPLLAERNNRSLGLGRTLGSAQSDPTVCPSSPGAIDAVNSQDAVASDAVIQKLAAKDFNQVRNSITEHDNTLIHPHLNLTIAYNTWHGYYFHDYIS